MLPEPAAPSWRVWDVAAGPTQALGARGSRFGRRGSPRTRQLTAQSLSFTGRDVVCERNTFTEEQSLRPQGSLCWSSCTGMLPAGGAILLG